MENQSKYWLSLDQWRQDPEFLAFAEKEFLSSPLQEDDGEKGGWARREFLKLMGASLALGSFGCLRRPAQMIVPYAKKPVDVVHGISDYYASTYVDGFEGFGTVVNSREGRPIKIEGNTEHPFNKGGMSARAHAHILSLYDPERLMGPHRNLQNEKKTNRETIGVKFEALDKAVTAQLKKGGVALLLGNSISPSTNQLVADFAGATSAEVYRWDALTFEDLRNAQESCYGKAVLPRWRFDQAEMIVSVGCDFLGSHISPTANAKLFAAGRKPSEKMSKLVVLESLLSLTGSNADERHRIGGQGELAALMGILHHLLAVKKISRYAGDGSVMKAVEPFARADEMAGLKAGTLAKIADELAAKGSKSLVVAGGWAQSSSSSAVQVAANFLNSVLGSDGTTVDYQKNAPLGGQSKNSDLNRLVANLNSGKVKTLIIHGCNPGYAAGTAFFEALKKPEMMIYTGDRMDETALHADYLAPDHHPLENWGDSEIIAGAYSVQQPTIQPLYDTRAFQDSLLVWAKGVGASSARLKSETWYDYVREYWKAIHSANRGKGPASKDFEDFWVDVLHVGVFDTAGDRSGTLPARGFNTSALSQITPVKAVNGYVLNMYSTIGLRDGSLGNVAWLQEFPDPVTKICWDNYLTVSPSDAAKEKLRESDVVRISVGDEDMDLPVHIQPGQADGVFGLAVGYGRTHGGKVANGVGQNAYILRSWQGDRAISSGLPVTKLAKMGRRLDLAAVQDHHSMEGRQIVVEQTLEQFQKDPAANIHRHGDLTMWPAHKYPNHKWGMTIDLNSCTGCGSCVIACQSENNVPTVGKKYVLKGREMHWLRIDRYYVGTPADPAVVNQPIVCMHCDNAPCETVCPVIATVHSDEGTNDMIYNRCVGTRYCSNNCPYKVRRFNWFNYVKPVEKPLNYAMNPDVTVRSRGVMEKCTFCIHRIKNAKMKAKLADRELKDGDVVTACQQSCPTNAIVFGDLNDPESAVSKKFRAENSYALLEELNTKPSVRYATKIRNSEHLKGGDDKGHHA